MVEGDEAGEKQHEQIQQYVVTYPKLAPFCLLHDQQLNIKSQYLTVFPQPEKGIETSRKLLLHSSWKSEHEMVRLHVSR